MSIEKFITDLLNLELEKIESLTSVDCSDGSIKIKVKLKQDSGIKCPLCGGKVNVHGYYERPLIHSVLNNRKCIILYSQRRYRCKTCEYSFHEINPFINSKESVTYETKVNVLLDLKQANSTYTAVAKRNNISITKVQRIFDKHVNIPRKKLPYVLSIDEHYFPASSYDSLYCCILMDFNTGIIIDVLPDRKKKYLISYFGGIRNETFDHKTKTSELNNVKYVSIDLYDNYKEIAKTFFPKAIICADSFHVLEHLTEAFRDIRLKCRRNTENEDLIYLLSKFRFIFNHDTNLDNEPKYNKRFGKYMNYRDMLNILFENFPELEQAYDLKESYIEFNTTCSVSNAKEELAIQIEAFGDSNIEEYTEFYNMLINWHDEIINSFSIVNSKRINNSYIESINKRIEVLLFNANGFTNFKRTRNRIMYCLNKDDKYKL